jgi:hypothetical protein
MKHGAVVYNFCVSVHLGIKPILLFNCLPSVRLHLAHDVVH